MREAERRGEHNSPLILLFCVLLRKKLLNTTFYILNRYFRLGLIKDLNSYEKRDDESNDEPVRRCNPIITWCFTLVNSILVDRLSDGGSNGKAKCYSKLKGLGLQTAEVRNVVQASGKPQIGIEGPIRHTHRVEDCTSHAGHLGRSIQENSNIAMRVYKHGTT